MGTFVGIDASKKRVAIVHLSANGKFLDRLYFETPSSNMDAYYQRNNYVYDYLLLRSMKHGELNVFVEDAYMGVSRRGSVEHAKVVGSILAACATYSELGNAPEPRVMMPATWRSKCGIKGRGKDPVWQWVTTNYTTSKIENQDIADALCIAYAGASIVNEEELQDIRKKGLA